MNFRPIVLAWLLLLGATFAMAGGAWWLLDREADRVEALAAASLANGAAGVAESVDLLMEEIRTGVGDGLLAARLSAQPRVGLAELVMNNPFVQTGFYYRESDGVTAFYGEHEKFPSPTELMESSSGKFPLTFEVEDEPATTQAAPDLSQIFNTPTPSPEPQQKAAAPSDVWQAAQSPMPEPTPETEKAEEFIAQQNVYSKSAALKQQRSNLRQVNEYSNYAVSNAQTFTETPANAPADMTTYGDVALGDSDAFQDNAGRDASVDFASSFDQAANWFGNDADAASASVQGYSFVGVAQRELNVYSENGANASQMFIGGFDQSSPNEQASAVQREPIRFLPDESIQVEGQQVVLEPQSQLEDEFVLADSELAQQARQSIAQLPEPPVSFSRAPQSAFPNRYIIRPPHQGWITENIDGAEQWMTWVDLRVGKDIMGVWLDREAVIAELSKTVSISQLKDVQFALINSSGERIAGAGGERYRTWSESESGPQLVLQVGAALPGWRIEAYPALRENPFGRSFRLLGGLVVAGLSVAILLGGSLLLWQAQRDAREAQRKTTFVANVSHELKTPLTSIRLFAEMLHDGRAGDEAKQRRYLQTMLNETQRLTRLVNNVLDFSRLERGRRDFQLESIDVGEAVQEVIDTQRERLHGEGLVLEYLAPETPVHANIDRDALEQILLNLLDNAAKYAFSGERAQVVLESLPDSWQLSVVDFGPGIPTREQRLVFEAFHRIDDRLTADRPGCGLGLSIAARLAQGLGGRLSLHPNQPQGCRFHLTVPNATAHA